MTWTKLPDDFTDRPVAWDLSDAAFRLAVAALVASNRLALDGRIPTRRLRLLVPRYRERDADELVRAGLWTRENDAVVIADDVLRDQPDRVEIAKTRESNRRRQKAWRERQRDARNGSESP